MASKEVESQHHADPMLNPENQHHHAHHHHTNFAEQGREDEVVYAHETTEQTDEKGISKVAMGAPSDDQSQNGKDEEAAATQPAARAWYRRAMKQWRHVAHAVIWLLFTG